MIAKPQMCRSRYYKNNDAGNEIVDVSLIFFIARYYRRGLVCYVHLFPLICCSLFVHLFSGTVSGCHDNI